MLKQVHIQVHRKLFLMKIEFNGRLSRPCGLLKYGHLNYFWRYMFFRRNYSHIEMLMESEHFQHGS